MNKATFELLEKVAKKPYTDVTQLEVMNILVYLPSLIATASAAYDMVSDAELHGAVMDSRYAYMTDDQGCCFCGAHSIYLIDIVHSDNCPYNRLVKALDAEQVVKKALGYVG